MELSWLNGFTKQWQDRLSSGRPPHAVMLSGPRGTGKRAAAAWLAASRSGRAEPDSMPAFPVSIPEHPDIYWVARQEDRHGA